MEPDDDLYKTLGVPRDASQDDIRKAYRSRSKRAHPDAGGTEKQFNALTTAHDVLTDPERRARYDETGQWESAKRPSDEQIALGLISDALMGVVHGDGDPVTVNLVEHLSQAFAKKIGGIEKQRNGTQRALDRTRKLKGRFRNRKRKANRIAGLIDWQIRALEAQIESMDRAIQDHEAAIKMLHDYDFEADMQMNVRVVGFDIGTSSSTSFFR